MQCQAMTKDARSPRNDPCSKISSRTQRRLHICTTNTQPSPVALFSFAIVVFFVLSNIPVRPTPPQPTPDTPTMADAPEKAPRMDPAIDANGTHDAEQKDKPRDSKGWDGKLRVEKNVLVSGKDQDADSDADDVSEDEGPPPEQLPADEDLLEDYPEDEEDIELVHLRVSNMAALRLERFKQLKVRGMRMRSGRGLVML
jgi:hypothetical protein